MPDRRIKLDHCVIDVTDWDRSNSGRSIYFRDPDGSLMELISYVP